MKNLKPLIDKLNMLYEQGYCVFYDLSGHVDWFGFRISASREDYDTTILKYSCISTKSKKDYIAEVISNIDKYILGFENKKHEALVKAEKEELETFKRLQKKYKNS